jgi:O-antigen/teichoic acid export membrane protein
MDHSLKKTTIKGLAWSLLESFGSQGTRFIIGIVLARLLVPEMFGLLAMLMIFIMLGEIFVDSGFGTALIQKQTITEIEICSVFYFNIFVGFVAAALLFFTAPVIAAFYEQPLLTSLARALSLIFIINSLGMIQSNLLVKKVDFKSQAKLITIANLVSGAVGIVLAIVGFGVWSLVIQQVSASVIRNFFYWFYSTWRPRLLFSLQALRGMMRFSLSILATGILNRTTEGIYYMVIGKLFSAGDLGIFSRAQQLQGFPSVTLATLVGRVTFPVFSKLQHDPVNFKHGVRKTLTIIAFLICPIMIGISAVAKPLVLVLLTEKWAATIPFLQLLCIGGLLFPMEWIRQQAIQAMGRPDLSLRVEVIKKILLFTGIAVMWRWGIFGIIAGIIFASLISLFLNMRYMAKLTQYSIKDQILDMLPYLVVALAMGGFVFSIGHLLRTYNPFFQLALQSIAGFIFYISITWIFRAPAFMSMQKELIKLLRKSN